MKTVERNELANTQVNVLKVLAELNNIDVMIQCPKTS